MITISDSKNNIDIGDEFLQKKDFGYLLLPKSNHWDIQIMFIWDFNNDICKEIIKSYLDGDSVIKKYINLIRSSEIVLDSSSYSEISSIIKMMIDSINLRDQAIVHSLALMFSYECYQNYVLENCYEITIDEIFNENLRCAYPYKHLKNLIFEDTRKIMKDCYNVDFDSFPI